MYFFLLKPCQTNTLISEKTTLARRFASLDRSRSLALSSHRRRLLPPDPTHRPADAHRTGVAMTTCNSYINDYNAIRVVFFYRDVFLVWTPTPKSYTI